MAFVMTGYLARKSLEEEGFKDDAARNISQSRRLLTLLADINETTESATPAQQEKLESLGKTMRSQLNAHPDRVAAIEAQLQDPNLRQAIFSQAVNDPAGLEKKVAGIINNPRDAKNILKGTEPTQPQVQTSPLQAPRSSLTGQFNKSLSTRSFNQPTLRSALAAATNSKSSAKTSTPTTTVAATTEPKMSEHLKEFKNKLETDETLAKAFDGIYGTDGANLSARQQMDELIKLETPPGDPEFFKKLNELTAKDGFTEFLEAAGGHQPLREMLSDTLRTSGSTPQEASQFLDDIDKAVKDDPDFFKTMTRTIDEHPQLVSSTIKKTQNDPGGVFAGLSNFTKLLGGAYALEDTVSGISPELGGAFSEMLAMLVNLLSEFMPEIQGIMNAAAPQQEGPETTQTQTTYVTSSDPENSLAGRFMTPESVVALYGPSGKFVSDTISQGPVAPSVAQEKAIQDQEMKANLDEVMNNPYRQTLGNIA